MFEVDKELLEQHVNKDIEDMKASRYCVECRFAMHTEGKYQVLLVITTEDDKMLNPENSYTIQAKSASKRKADERTTKDRRVKIKITSSESRLFEGQIYEAKKYSTGDGYFVGIRTVLTQGKTLFVDVKPEHCIEV